MREALGEREVHVAVTVDGLADAVVPLAEPGSPRPDEPHHELERSGDGVVFKGDRRGWLVMVIVVIVVVMVVGLEGLDVHVGSQFT